MLINEFYANGHVIIVWCWHIIDTYILLYEIVNIMHISYHIDIDRPVSIKIHDNYRLK